MPFMTSAKDFMINYIVAGPDAVIESLEKNDTTTFKALKAGNSDKASVCCSNLSLIPFDNIVRSSIFFKPL